MGGANTMSDRGYEAESLASRNLERSLHTFRFLNAEDLLFCFCGQKVIIIQLLNHFVYMFPI